MLGWDCTRDTRWIYPLCNRTSQTQFEAWWQVAFLLFLTLSILTRIRSTLLKVWTNGKLITLVLQHSNNTLRQQLGYKVTTLQFPRMMSPTIDELDFISKYKPITINKYIYIRIQHVCKITNCTCVELFAITIETKVSWQQ